MQGNEAIVSEQLQSNVDESNEYEIKLRAYESKMIRNLGNNGEGAYLDDSKDREMGQETLKKLALNTVLSDRMPLNRTLRDPRNPG